MKTVVSLAAMACALLAAPVAAQNPTVTPYGNHCGPVLTGEVVPSGATWRFSFTVSNGTPSGRVLLVVGVNETAAPLPTTPCFLLTEIAFSQQHRLDMAGSYTWSHALSAEFHGYARVQFIEVAFTGPIGVTFTPSNGVLMVIP